MARPTRSPPKPRAPDFTERENAPGNRGVFVWRAALAFFSGVFLTRTGAHFAGRRSGRCDIHARVRRGNMRAFHSELLVDQISRSSVMKFIRLLAIAAGLFAASSGLAQAQGKSPPTIKNVVLVHGAWADGSSWAEVLARLQAAGLKVTAVQNPLTTLAESVAATRSALALQDGPTVLVAHSWGGTVLSEVGVDPKVTALVYVAARAPDAGEDYTALAKKYPTPPATAGIVFNGDWGQLSEQAFLRDFAGDLPPDE